jgi:hypothetical protein
MDLVQRLTECELGSYEWAGRVAYDNPGNQLQSRYLDELYQNLLSALDSWLMIPARCPACWERLELTRDEVISWAQDFWIHDIWFWRCSQCGYQTTRNEFRC